MSKVKIVQIAIGGSSEEYDVQYLDDKGRVWVDRGNIEKYTTQDAQGYPVTSSKWVSKYVQLELPEDPDEDS